MEIEYIVFNPSNFFSFRKRLEFLNPRKLHVGGQSGRSAEWEFEVHVCKQCSGRLLEAFEQEMTIHLTC